MDDLLDLYDACFARIDDVLNPRSPVKNLFLVGTEWMPLGNRFEIERLAASPQLARVEGLHFLGCQLDAGGVRTLVSSPHLVGLKRLAVSLDYIGDDGARAIAGAPALASLEELFLLANAIGPEGARALASSRNLNRLTFLHLNGTIALERELAAQGLFPAVDPLASTSRLLDPLQVGEDHYNTAREVQRVLQRYKDLQDIIAILGVEELPEDDKVLVGRARRIQRYLTQPMFVAQRFTGYDGRYVPIKDT